MSYIKAEDILPEELLKKIQKYVNGRLIYIPCVEKREWGSGTDSREFFRERNERIFEDFLAGTRPQELALLYALSEKSIQRILREQRAVASIKEVC